MKLYAILPVLCLALIIGCDLSKVDPGGGATSPTSVSLRGKPAEIKGPDIIDGPGGGITPPDLTVEPGILVGRVIFDGPAPTLPPKVAKSQITVDAAVCGAKGDILDDSMVVDPKTNGIGNVFVYLEKRPKWLEEKPEWDPEVEPAVADQLYCVFTPHAVVARLGKMTLKNSDGRPHNVKSGSRFASFNVGLSPGGIDTDSVVFKRVEKDPFPSSCAIHSWMNFYTLVVDHPYAAVTDKDGNFKIPNLPAGTHTFRVWHERAGALERSFQVTIPSGGESQAYELKYSGSKFKLK